VLQQNREKLKRLGRKANRKAMFAKFSTLGVEFKNAKAIHRG
jgi:hypothetical protein